jgi:hypothetical protein
VELQARNVLRHRKDDAATDPPQGSKFISASYNDKSVLKSTALPIFHKPVRIEAQNCHLFSLFRSTG